MKHLAHGTAVTALTALTVAVVSGSAHADPAAAQRDSEIVSVQLAPGAEFTGALSDGSSVLQTPIGTVALRDGQLAMTDAAQQPVLGTPWETAATAGANAVSPEPITPVAPVAGGDPLGDLSLAWHESGAYTGLGAAVGGTAGSLVGAALGCPIGAVTLGSMATVMSAAALTMPGMIGGCLAGAATGAAFGGMIGAATVGLPVGAAVTVQKYNEIQQQRAAGLPVAPPQQH